jgi:hypothetical protein
LNEKPGESATRFAITFQCPGGVSLFGPSAQNSASARPKSPRRTTFDAYGWFVIGLSAWPVPSFAPSVLFPYAPGEMSIVVGSFGSSWLERVMTSSRYPFIASPTTGAGPGSCQGTWSDERVIANGVTPPHCEPMYVCTPAGRMMPFCVAATERFSGCHTFGSTSVAPGSSTTSGGFTGLYGFGSA